MTRPNSYFDRLRRRPKRVKIVTRLGIKGAKRSEKARSENSDTGDEPRSGWANPIIGPVSEL